MESKTSLNCSAGMANKAGKTKTKEDSIIMKLAGDTLGRLDRKVACTCKRALETYQKNNVRQQPVRARRNSFYVQATLPCPKKQSLWLLMDIGNKKCVVFSGKTLLTVQHFHCFPILTSKIRLALARVQHSKSTAEASTRYCTLLHC